MSFGTGTFSQLALADYLPSQRSARARDRRGTALTYARKLQQTCAQTRVTRRTRAQTRVASTHAS